VLPLDEVVVFHEITNGPFQQGDAVVADWAPHDPPRLRAFLHDAALASGLPAELAARIQRPAS
jgi:hypothetical protein